MRMKLRLGMAVAAVVIGLAGAAFAGDMFNAKEGLWEMTVTTSGMGQASAAMANLTPEQRAMAEQAMKQHGMSMSMNGNTMTIKSCVTKDKLNKGSAFSDSRNSDCTRTITKASTNHMEVKFHCETNSGTTDGNSIIDIAGDGVKGTTHVTNVSNGNSKTFDSTFTSKYLGADCGDVK